MRIDSAHRVEVEKGDTITIVFPNGDEYYFKEGPGPGFQIFKAAADVFVKTIVHHRQGKVGIQGYGDVIVVDGDPVLPGACTHPHKHWDEYHEFMSCSQCGALTGPRVDEE